MITLDKIIKQLPKNLVIEVKASSILEEIIVDNLQLDSRQVQKNSLFVALRGEQVDGHDYIEKTYSL